MNEIELKTLVLFGECDHVEFKKELCLSNSPEKAEFIKDVIALCNRLQELSEPHAYLIIGVKDGIYYHVADAYNSLDEANIKQILEASVTPKPEFVVMTVNIDGKDIKIVKIDRTDSFYVVKKQLNRNQGKHLLVPGQSWNRKNTANETLTGQEILEKMEKSSYENTLLIFEYLLTMTPWNSFTP